MFWYEIVLYGLSAFVIVVSLIFGQLYLEVRSLRALTQKQNGLLKKNLAELRDEYARLNRAVTKERKGLKGEKKRAEEEKNK